MARNQNMNNYPPSIQKLIDIFSRFPTVGPRTASRFVFYLMRLTDQEIKEILEAVSNFRKNVKTCSFCFNTFESSQAEATLCPICSDNTRNRKLLCLIEKESDLNILEKTKKYNGLYFILGETKSKRTEELVKRIKNNNFKEIIIAINPTTQGDAEILRIERLLKPFAVKISHLGRGLPVGAELEYADEETLSSALEGRK